MTPKSRERADKLAQRMEDERTSWASINYPAHKKLVDLLEETRSHFTKCLEDTEGVVALHVEDIKALMGHCMALAKRVSALEEKLGIAESAEVPGD